MENIEELKQANDKLNARLAKAVEVFKEQKAQIETLTKEKEELENKLKEAGNFEADTINKVVPELEEKVRSLEAKEEAYKKEIVNLQGQLIKSNEDLQKKVEQMKTIDLEQKKIIEARDQWMGMAKELENKVKEFDIKAGEAELKLEGIQKEYTKKFEEQEIELKKKEEEIKAFNTKYDELENEKMAYAADYEKLENEYKKLHNDYDSLENTMNVYSHSDDALKEIIKVLNKFGYESSEEIKVKESNKQNNGPKNGANPMNGEMMRMA